MAVLQVFSSPWHLLAAFCGALFVHRMGVIIYRLYLHPLAKFPGPKIAAATHLYEIGWDYFGRGAYLWEIERMHRKYGTSIFPGGSQQS